MARTGRTNPSRPLAKQPKLWNLAQFGRTAQGGTLDTGYAGSKIVSKFTGIAGQLYSITAWVNVISASPQVLGIIYADNAGVPGARLGYSAIQTLDQTGIQKVVFLMPTGINLAAGTPYWLGYGASGGTISGYTESLGVGAHSYNAYNTPPSDPFGSATISSSSGDLSVYADALTGGAVLTPLQLDAGLTLTPTMAPVAKHFISFNVGLTLTPAVQKKMPKTVPVGLTLSPALQRKMFKSFGLPSAYPIAPVKDSAVRANEGPPLSLPFWLAVPSTPGLKIISNKFAATATWCAQAYQETSADMEAYVTVDTASHVLEFDFRVSELADLNFNGYAVMFDITAQTYTVNRVDAGSYIAISGPTSLAMANGVVLGVRMYGSTIEVWKNGALLVQVQDTTYSAAGYTIMWLYQTTIRASNFGAGGIGPSLNVKLTPTMVKNIPKAVPVGLTLTGAMTNQAKHPRAVAAGLTLTPTLIAQKIAPRTIAASLTLTPTMSRVAIFPRTIAAGLTLTPTMVKAQKYPRTLSAGLTLTPTLARLAVFPRTLAAGLTLTPTLARVIKAPRTISATLTLSPTLNRKLFNTVPVGLTLTPTMAQARTSPRTLAAGLTLTGVISLLAKHPRSIAASLTLTPTLATKSVRYRSLAASLTLTSALATKKTYYRSLSAALTLTPTLAMQKKYVRALAASLTMGTTLSLISHRLRQMNAALTLTPTMNIEQFLALDTPLVLTAAESHAFVGLVHRSMDASLVLEPTMGRIYAVSLPADLHINPFLSIFLLHFDQVVLSALAAQAQLLSAKSDEPMMLAAEEEDKPVLVRASSPQQPVVRVGERKPELVATIRRHY